MIRGYTDTFDTLRSSKYGDRAVESRNTFFKVLRAIQITVLVIGTIMFLAWCGSYFIEDTRTSVSSYRVAERQIAGEESDEETYNMESGMLPDHLIPLHYNLTLQLFMPPTYNFTTKGNTQILFECMKKTKLIILHSRDLNISQINLSSIDDSKEKNSTYKIDPSSVPQKQLMLALLDKPLEPKTKYLLDISFTGTINNNSVGLYRSSYSADNSTVSWIASTQFQPSDARRVFPCFDEPGYKATFQLNLVHDKKAVALSNMPIREKITIDDEWEITSFEETPRMSSYLLSFVVGDIASNTENRTNKIQIWSRKDMVSYGDFALSIAPKILQFLEDYIEVRFTLPKLDLVAIPSFLHAAMENWGLVTFDESALLYDPMKSSTENKVAVTLTIAHEFAHQWFGNLVTPAWWDNLWLNEGFATYYEYLGIQSFLSKWNIMHLFISSVYEVMETDSLLTTRAMGAPVHPDQVLEYFDSISYLKGGAIVRMLQHFIGEDGFKRGIKNYLSKYSYKSSNENNLWQNLNLWNRNKYGIRQIMTTWTNQSGYPVINIIRNYENKSAVITQEPFSLEYEEDDDERAEKKNSSSLWTVPLTFTNGIELDWSTGTDMWLNKISGEYSDFPDNDTWIIANLQQVGFYRVNYDDSNWELLLQQLLENHTDIHVINRAQLLNDALNLARSDRIEYSLALNMTKYLYLEEEFLPWQAAFSAFNYLDLMLAKTPGHEAWKVYLLTLMTPIYKEFGWNSKIDEDDILARFLRKKILKWNCEYENEDCIKAALTLFRQWKNGSTENETISADVREVVLCTGIAKGNTDDWEFMWKHYQDENFKPEKNILLKSLACTRETRLLRKLLKRAMNSESGIPLQDGSDVFIYIAENFYGRDIVYDFFKNHMDEISFRFGSFAFAGGNIVDRVTASLNSENEIEELQSILKGRYSSLQGIRHALSKALHRSKNNANWMKEKYNDIYTWLQDNSIQETYISI
ncbi:thyrotropin-releasing hormone-degrading ectoenzyme [Parasteatoda tepidariorum]|uniref:thyrotropin-releasing hormone-degrading ectoenzyme n=1 Tax=Parasteatoda tepidariorum TaxID=114398 RepID=UPI00077FCB20|nr:thyrotropin-releasing hormone-degrading ectoenzyme [Parasteatoda tepidariorum]